MSRELSTNLSSEIVSSIILKNDLSSLTPEQRVQYVAYRSAKVGLDPAAQPFILIEGNGKLSLYATKEAAAQLNQNRSLSPVCVKEETLFDGTVYKVTYRVTENGRATEDCGAVGLVKVKKQNGKPDEYIKLSPFEMADAVMKAHTKAKRRTILTHCGIGTNDADEDLLIVVPDAPPRAEEIKEADAKIKEATPAEIVKKADEKHAEKKANGYQPEVQAKKNGDTGHWEGTIDGIQELELPDKNPCWEIRGKDGAVFKTAERMCFEIANEAGKHTVEIEYKLNAKGTKVIHKLRCEALV